MAEIKEVFISYHEKTAGELVADIADKLESAGISCWYARRDLPSGKSFADCIPQQIKHCKVFLLILNEGTNHSKHIRNEMTLAFRRLNKEKEITILPYGVEKCVFADWLDYFLAQIQIQPAETMDMGALATEIAHKLGREPTKNGKCGPGVNWTFQDGVLTISKAEYSDSGKMGDFYPQNVPECVNTPWWSEHDKITSVIIKRGITNIGDFAFSNCSILSNVNIPDSVTSIGCATFSECNNLTNINIPDSVACIGYSAFLGCSNLNSIDIPNSVTNIGWYAFGDCDSLTQIDIPDSIVTVENFSFAFCGNLHSVHIPDSIIKIGIQAFIACSNLTNVNIPDSVIYIESQAFRSCESLKSVSIPANAIIADDAFDPTTEVIRRPAR